MMEILAKRDVRFDRSFNFGSIVNFVSLMVTLLTVLTTGYFTIAAMKSDIRDVTTKQEQNHIWVKSIADQQRSDHDIVTGTSNDVKWLKSVIEKKSQGLQSPFDPTPMMNRSGAIAATPPG